MKTTKKLLAMLLVVMMTLALAAPAFADEEPMGKITLTNASIGKEYSVYKLLDATYNTETHNTAYSTKSSAFAVVLSNAIDNTTSDAIFTVGAAADSEGNYSVAVSSDAMLDAALEWMKANAETYGTLVEGSEKTAATTTLEWEVPYGYYFITSSLGTVLTIDKNTPSANVIDKNTTEPVTPDPDPEDPTRTGAKSVTESSATIGDTVHFTVQFTATNFVTSTAVNGDVTSKQITRYVVKDMPSSLKLNSDIKVVVGTTEISSAIAFNENNELELPWVNGSGSIYASPVDVTITYTGVVTSTAVNEGKATNSAAISYVDEDDNTVVINPDDPAVKIITCSFTLNKVDGQENPLSGAVFKLYNADGSEIPVVKCSSATEIYYRVAEKGESNTENIVAGTVAIKGLAVGDYYLEEIQAPAGYNRLTAREKVTVADGTNTITIENNTGIELPATGGMGTVLFLTVGAIVVLAAGIVLTAKKRLYNEG